MGKSGKERRAIMRDYLETHDLYARYRCDVLTTSDCDTTYPDLPRTGTVLSMHHCVDLPLMPKGSDHPWTKMGPYKEV